MIIIYTKDDSKNISYSYPFFNNSNLKTNKDANILIINVKKIKLH